jgi:hypothetical protein
LLCHARLGNIHSPIATLVANPDYPIYAVDFQQSTVAVGGGGGGTENSFLGVPALLYDIKAKTDMKAPEEQTSTAVKDASGTHEETSKQIDESSALETKAST